MHDSNEIQTVRDMFSGSGNTIRPLANVYAFEELKMASAKWPILKSIQS